MIDACVKMEMAQEESRRWHDQVHSSRFLRAYAPLMNTSAMPWYMRYMRIPCVLAAVDCFINSLETPLIGYPPQTVVRTLPTNATFQTRTVQTS